MRRSDLPWVTWYPMIDRTSLVSLLPTHFLALLLRFIKRIVQWFELEITIMVHQFATRNRKTIMLILERVDHYYQYIKEMGAVTIKDVWKVRSPGVSRHLRGKVPSHALESNPSWFQDGFVHGGHFNDNDQGSQGWVPGQNSTLLTVMRTVKFSDLANSMGLTLHYI